MKVLSRLVPAVAGSLGGDRLELRQVVWSGGSFPVSVAVDGDHAHVLDALDGGAGIVGEFAAGSGGALSPIGSVTVAGAVGGEGIVAL